HTQFGNNVSVYRNQSGRNVFVGLAPRTNTCIGNEPVQAHFTGGGGFFRPFSRKRNLLFYGWFSFLFKLNHFFPFCRTATSPLRTFLFCSRQRTRFSSGSAGISFAEISVHHDSPKFYTKVGKNNE